MNVTATAYPRIGLIGNPSDGYGGCVIAATFRNFLAEVTLAPASGVRITNAEENFCEYHSLQDMADRCDKEGYPITHRLMTAAVRRFLRHSATQSVDRASGFSLDYRSTIPREVGMAGSSALVVAVLKALNSLYETRLDSDALIAIALKAETEELGIAAGLMDRTVQVLEGALFFDCAAESVTASAQTIKPSNLPRLYLAYNEALACDSGTIHNDVKARYEAGDPTVRAAMTELRELACTAFDRLQSGQADAINALLDRNYDIRASIFEIDPHYDAMVRVARSAGASAKFAGSGGTVVGVCSSDALQERLATAFSTIGAKLIIPQIG